MIRSAMATLPIIRLGHPSLRIQSKPVRRAELEEEHVQAFIDDLIETCRAAQGAGLAAPQVGVNRRVIVVNVPLTESQSSKGGEEPPMILVNPQITSRAKEMTEDWEGDLSADVRGVVPRPKSCVIQAWDRNGEDVRYELHGFTARVFQHEIGHLNGEFLTDLIRRKETLSEVDTWKRYWGQQTSFSLPKIEGHFDFPKASQKGGPD